MNFASILLAYLDRRGTRLRMRALATVSSVLAALLLLLPWQLCTCSEDGAHLKTLWDQSECPHEHEQSDGDDPDGNDSDSDDPGSDDPGRQHSEDCDGLFRFAGAEGDAVLDLPPAADGTSLLPSLAMLSVIDGERPARADDPAEAPGEVLAPESPVQARTRLLL